MKTFIAFRKEKSFSFLLQYKKKEKENYFPFSIKCGGLWSFSKRELKFSDERMTKERGEEVMHEDEIKKFIQLRVLNFSEAFEMSG